MKLEQLRILDAVVKAGSFAQAANEILLISQPAVSTAIRKLEEQLGFLLFSRDTYRPALTDAGQAFYQKALRVLREAEELEMIGKTLSQGNEPEIRIAFDAELFPPIIETLKQQTLAHPCTQFRLSSEILFGALDRLVDHEVDLIITQWLPQFDHLFHHFQFHPLADMTLSSTCAPDFPPYQWQRTVQPSDLKGMIQVVSRSSERFIAEKGFGLFDDCLHWYVNDGTTKKSLIQAGIGFGVLPHHLIQQELQTGKIVPFENLATFKLLKAHIRMVRRKDSQGPVLEALWNALKQLPYMYF